MVIITKKIIKNNETFIVFQTHDTGRNLADNEHVVADSVEPATARENLFFLKELLEKFFQRKFKKSSFEDSGRIKQETFPIQSTDVRFIETPIQFERFADAIYGWFKIGEGKNYKTLSRKEAKG